MPTNESNVPLDVDISETLKRRIDDAYTRFEYALKIEYSADTARQRLYTLRQFCDYLKTGRPPKQFRIPSQP